MNTFHPRFTFSTLAVVLALLASVWVTTSLKIWKRDNRVLAWDVLEYYSYLPAAFIHHDLSFQFMQQDPDRYNRQFWVHTAPNGGKYLKMTMGMSVMYAPFFLLCRCAEMITGHDSGGFSNLYKLFLLFSSWFYLFAGLLLLRSVLKRYFSDLVTGITLFSLVVGTNLLYYSSIEACMSHAYNFALFSLFLWLTIRYYEKPSVPRIIGIGFLAGLITLIRPSNIILLLLFFGWGITNWEELKKRFFVHLRQAHVILLMALAFITVWFPQLLYWKLNTGQWFFYTYGDERLFLTRPALLESLFSYRKGWLLYTPMMVLTLAGFVFLWKQVRQAFWPLLLFTVLYFWIVSSWWCWWYGGGYGLRPMIDMYGLLSLPLAAFITGILEKKGAVRFTGIALVLLLNAHSVFQNFQYYYGAIHWDSMTRAAYWNSFGHLHPRPDMPQLLQAPDYQKAKEGIR